MILPRIWGYDYAVISAVKSYILSNEEWQEIAAVINFIESALGYTTLITSKTSYHASQARGQGGLDKHNGRG